MLDLSNCRCIIFDLDGTILDSTQVWAKVDMDFLGRRGIPVSKEYMQEIKTHTFESGSVYTKEKYNLPESTEEIMKEISTGKTDGTKLLDLISNYRKGKNNE